MKKKFFGTDGIRGTANEGVMTPEIALKVGQAAGSYFIDGDHRHKVVIGKDTRLSGYMIEPALVAGFVSAGMDVFIVGPMPTPAVAMLTRSLRCDLGVMISASHNPFFDNGIKLFDKIGHKLSDDVELEIEKRIQGIQKFELASSKNLGTAKRFDDAQGRYIEFAKATFPRRMNLSGVKIVLDCANGAAYKIAPTILWELGADVIALGTQPNGFNINDKCGSTYPRNICAEVLKNEADIGISLDGDADRLVVCDENGKIVDGDQIMALIAKNQQQKGTLQGDAVVATSMSNLGLEKYLESINLNLIRTQVGDRYVARKMRELGCNVGGEQSGHVIMSNFVTTGDGIVAALQVLSMMVGENKKSSEVCSLFEPYPQILKNIRYKNKNPLELTEVKQEIDKISNKISATGRVLVRTSGTEPLIRVMVEAQEKDVAEENVNHLVNFIQERIGEE